MTRSFEVSWNDLKEDAQEAILESCIESLTEEYQKEGEEFLKKEWHEPKPKTWQEAYCREYAIEWQYWSDYEKGKLDAEEPTEAEWADWVNEEIRDKAETACFDSMHHLEIEVEL